MSFILSRDRSVARPGYSRWLVPPAALAIHLSIGQIYAYSVFSGPMHQLVGVTEPAAGDWSIATIGWIFTVALAVLGRVCRDFWQVARACRSADGDVCLGLLFRRRLFSCSLRRIYPQYLARLSWERRAGRYRVGSRLHLTGVNADQVVSRPSRLSYRHGDHGFRRRRDDRFTAFSGADEPLFYRHVGRGRADALYLGHHLLRLYDVRRVYGAGTAGKLETSRLRRADNEQKTRHERQRRRRYSRSHAAVLAAVRRFVP